MPEQAFTLTLVQSSLVWQDPAANRNHFNAVLDQIDRNTDLIILPEMFTTGFSMEAQKFAEPHNSSVSLLWMKEQAEHRGAAICGSLMVEDQGQYYNRLYFVSPTGEQYYYDKRHLFSYAEEDDYFSAGKQRLVLSYKNWKICPLICYDLRFPAWARNTVDYDLLIYVANWPDKRRDAWKKLLAARAIENLSYTVGLNRVGQDGKGHNYAGDSCVVDFAGEVRLMLAQEEKWATITLNKEDQVTFRERFGFLEDQDKFEFAS